ncbi:MAG TPA: DUF5689 domain-containing protein [Flavobacterium sp.]|nr:DUF5689 domain-containing protein [Flavobacterium sp.]
MKLNVLKSAVLLAIIATIFTGCTDSDKPYHTGTPEVVTYEMTATKEVSAINATTTATVYPDDDIIEAYVTSNDAGGNFYKSISFQTIPDDNTNPIGFSMPIDGTMLFVKGFTPGRKVYIKLKGLAIAKVFGSMQIGVVDPTDNTTVARISGLEYQNYLFPSSVVVDENTFVRQMTLAQASVDAVQNTLIEITNTQFSDNSLARTYYDIDSGGLATNQEIVDVTTGGRSRFLRVSSFAPFSTGMIPSGRGIIRGVMTKYNSDYQFLVRQESDFKLNDPRTYTFFSTLNETFAGYTASSSYNQYTSFTAFPNYLNFATVGTKRWFVKTGGILEMSAFGGNVESTKAYFIVPVDMTAANSVQFNLTVTFFQAALGLKVYRSNDYVPGKSINDATLYDISTSLSTPLPSANGVLTGLTYNIPANVTGNGYIIFEYAGTNLTNTGGPVVTTTIDLDNIIVN